MKITAYLLLTATALFALCSQAQTIAQLHPPGVTPPARPNREQAALPLDLKTASAVVGTLPGGVQTVRDRAISGDPAAQTKLAELLYDGQIVKKDPVEAYKWAFLAAAEGNKNAKHLLRELDLFMTPEQKQQAKALAEQYFAERTKVAPKSEPEPKENKKPKE